MQVTDSKFNFFPPLTFFTFAVQENFFVLLICVSVEASKLIVVEMFANETNCSGRQKKSFSLVECRLSPIHHVCGFCKYLRFADKKMFYLRNAKHDTFALKIL